MNCKQLLDAGKLVELLDRGNLFTRESKMFGTLLEEVDVIVSDYYVNSKRIRDSINSMRFEHGIVKVEPEFVPIDVLPDIKHQQKESDKKTIVDPQQKQSQHKKIGSGRYLEPKDLNGYPKLPDTLKEQLRKHRSTPGFIIPKHIFEQIQIFKEEHGISNKKLAKMTGISYSCIANNIEPIKDEYHSPKNIKGYANMPETLISLLKAHVIGSNVPPQIKSEIINYYVNTTASKAAISQMTSLTIVTIHNILRGIKSEYRDISPIGRIMNISPKDEMRIKDLWYKNYNLSEIARDLEVPRNLVRNHTTGLHR